MEGIMMRGPEKICCAVRKPDGTIDLSYDTVTTHWYNKVPLVRGVCNMAENLYKGYRYLMHAADIAMEGETEPAESKLDKWFEAHATPAVQNALMTCAAFVGVALALFLYGGNAMWVNVLSMVLFGIAIGVLICFLGGLMAVDIVPRKATGAALGVVGIASYCAAGIQDVASGWLIDSHITVATDGAKHYDFGPVALFWIAASVISFLLPLMNRKQKTEA